MLVLKNQEGFAYNLTTKEEHTIGRTGNLEIANDLSISRQHASVTVKIKRSKFLVELCDSGSKYGTFMNEGIISRKEIPKNSPIALNLGDRIKFGQWNTWTLEETQFVICAPILTPQEKTLMNKVIAKINGVLVSSWTKNCTHLTLSEIKMDSKIACALAEVKPIVTVDYWRHLLSALNSRKEQSVPNYVDFIPPFSDKTLQSKQFDFSMQNSRRSLFKNIKFFTFNRQQHGRVLPMVEAASGTVSLITGCDVSEESLTDINLIVLQCKESSREKSAEKCASLLKSHNKRTIFELEICLSIADGSRERFCNPSYDASILFKQENSFTMREDATVLAEDTQNLEEDDTDIQERDTGSNFSLTVEQNRVSAVDEDDIIIEDSPPLEDVSVDTRSAMKRKLENAEQKPPTKCSKLDSFVIRKKADDTVHHLESTLSSPSRDTKPALKDIFSFRNVTRTSKTSSSLFANVGSRLKQGSSSLFEKNSENSSSVIPDSLKKSTEEMSENKPRFSLRSSLTKLNNTCEVESPALFSSFSKETGESSSSRLGSKRKLTDEPSGSPFGKKPNKSSKHLFGNSSRATTNEEERINRMDSGDSFDGSLKQDISNLKISKEVKRITSVPVVNVPTTVSLTQFTDAHAGSRIKMEPDLEVSSEIKDVLNKTVILTVPLLKEKSTVTSSEPVRNFLINFKKFKKNTYARTTQIVPVI